MKPHNCKASKLIKKLYLRRSTLHPVYSELAYSEYLVIVNGFLRTDR